MHDYVQSWSHELQVYLNSQPKVNVKASGCVHQVFTLDNYSHYIPLGVKKKASKIELLVQGKKLYHRWTVHGN